MDSPSLNTVVEAPATGLALFLACVFILYKIVKKRPGEHGTLPPGPRPWPLLGNLHQLGDLPHQSLAALAKKYGPLMFIRLGSIPAVVVSSPAMAKEFLKTHDRLFADRPTVSAGKYLAYEAKGMGYAPYGDYWRQMKRLCTLELLTPKRTESFISLREEEVATMIRSIWNESEQGARCVDLSKLFFSLTLNIVSRMSAGRTFSDQELSGGRKFKEILGEMMALAGAFVVADFIPLLEYIDLQGLRRRMKSLHQIYDEFGEKVIDEHINRRNQKAEEERGVKDLVDIMLDMSEAGSHSADLKVTRLNIKAIILDILIAGVETSSTTVDWAMRELLKNPCAMATAQQEIESVVGLGRNGLLKESDIKDCVYLRCLVKETLRLHPPGPLLIPHQSTEGRTVGRYHIPKRTRLFVNVWAMGRDESIWEDPYLFKPDRFMGKNIDLRGQHYELLPFGTGRRGCPGISMGLCVVELALAQLLHCFDWSVEGEVNMEEMFGLTVPGKFSISARPLWRLISGGANM